MPKHWLLRPACLPFHHAPVGRSLCAQLLDLRLQPVPFLPQQLHFREQGEEVGLASSAESQVVTADDGGPDRPKVEVAVMV